MKRTAYHLAITALVTTLALSSCTWKKEKGVPPEAGPAFEPSVTEQTDSYASWATIVEGSGSVEELDKTEVSSGSTVSLGSAINSENLKECQKLPKTDIQACEDAVRFKIGTENHDYAACEKISRARNRQICTSRVSKYFLNVGDCQKISEDSVKKACLEKTVAEDAKITAATAEAYQKIQQAKSASASASTPETRVSTACSTAIGRNKTYCYSTKVDEEIAKGADSKLCSVIPDAAAKESCQQKAAAKSNKSILDAAIAAKDPTKCDAITIAQDRDLCKTIVKGWN